MTYLPIEAADIFNAGYGTDEVVRRKIKNAEGKPASSRTARRWRQEWKKTHKEVDAQQEEINDELVINLDTSEVKKLDDLLRECEIDQELWEVVTCEITKHEVPRKDTVRHLEFDEGKITGHIHDDGRMYVQVMYNIRIVLKRRAVKPFEDALDSLLDTLRANPPQFNVITRTLKGEYLFSPQMYDPHFNKRSAGRSYSVVEAAEDFRRVGDALISRMSSFNMPVDRILFPVGNDALHADNIQGTTTKGTWVELAGDQSVAIREMCDAYVHVITNLRTIAPVDIPIIPGNHDRYSSYWLGLFLQAWFKDCKDVTVDTSTDPRKYYSYGKMLIGLEHGDKVKHQDLIALMATEAPKQWAESTHRIWMRGHLHGRDAAYHPISEKYGTTVMTIPALCDTDEYHVLHGFVGNHRAAEGMLFHKKHGLSVTFPVFVDELL